MNQGWKIFSRRWAISALGFLLAVQVQIASADSPQTAPASPSTQPADEHPSDASASIKTWFADLANSDAAIRSDALTNLMGLSADDLPILKKVVEESTPLRPAQATVLHQIVTQVFLAGDHYEGNPVAGFLGVRMEQTAVSFRDALTGDWSLPSLGVVITERIPGFAGARKLRDGDVVLAILDRPNADATNLVPGFAMSVGAMPAGAIVHFQILRQGQVIHVDVKLDARPMEADPAFGISGEFLEHRRERAEEFWTTHFAKLVKDGIS